MPSAAEPLPEPARLARRRTDAFRERTSRDRLTTMLVLAALLHGMVILGVSFTAPDAGKGPVDRGMEVLLVSDELPEARQNPTATYLSQRTQTGSGNTQERLAARLPSQSRPQSAPARAQAAAATDPEEILASNAATGGTPIQILPVPPELGGEEAPPGAADPTAPQRAGDDELVLRGLTRDELYLAADTRASRLAPYLDAWRRRVERVGTLNYPSAAQRQGLKGNPVIEVTLQRDGRLRSARIQKSSGRAEIDASALDILRLASPFDPFPPELARDYRTLRFAYEWRFEGRGAATGAVTVP
jgi:periplasmic protein TonB